MQSPANWNIFHRHRPRPRPNEMETGIQPHHQGAIIPHHARADVQFIPVPIHPVHVPHHHHHLRGGGPIVPYVSREVFPLRVIYYLLQEEDGDDDDNDDDDDVDDHDHINRRRRHRHVHIHVPIALALHPNTILSYGDRGRRRSNNANGNGNHASTAATATAPNDLHHHHQHDRRKRVKLEEKHRSKHEDVNVCDDDDETNYNPVEKVCDIEGILQHILGYNHDDPQDLLSASLVNHRWFEAARDDELWKCACAYAWGNKVGMPLVRRGGSIALFWRSLWGEESVVRGCTSTEHVGRGGNSTCTSGSGSSATTTSRPVSSSDRNGGCQKSKMSVKDIKGLFAERPLGRKVVRDAFSACFEKTDMQKAVVELMPETLGGEECGMDSSRILKRERGDGFDRLWFGSFASSMIDSKRTIMTLDELLSRRGFLMHFKVFHSHVTTTSTQHDTNNDEDNLHNSRRNGDINDRGEREEDVSLHFHCICYFDEAVREGGGGDVGPPVGKFRLDESNNREMEHPQNLTWHWLIEGRTVQVGQYPPLVIYRLDDWGWRIENRHVVLYSQ